MTEVFLYVDDVFMELDGFVVNESFRVDLKG